MPRSYLDFESSMLSAGFLFERVFFQQIGNHVKSLMSFGRLTNLGDEGGWDGGGFVAEIVTHVGEYGGNLGVFKDPAEGRHRDLAIVFFAIEV